MERRKKNPVEVAARGAVTRPYTGPGNGEHKVMNSADAATLRAVDRKVTDGLNLLHGQLEIGRQERIEDRRELREGLKELRTEFKAEFTKAEARSDQRINELRAELRGEFGKMDARTARVESTMQEFAAQISTSLERSLGTRRVVPGVVGAFALLVAGGMVRPLFERAVAALFGS